MHASLYDEDKWPSGYGGGRVTKEHPEYALKYLLFSSVKYEDGPYRREKHTSGRLTEDGELCMVAAYRVELAGRKWVSYRRVEKEDAQANYFAYVVSTGPLAWFDNERYTDVLSPEAVDAFIACTHERYRDVLGERLQKRSFRIFSDEPQFSRVETLSSPESEAGIPFTPGFDEKFSEKYGKTLADCLPEIFFEAADGSSGAARYHYMDMLSEQFAQSYLERISLWCSANGMLTTGHLMMEDDLAGQAKCSGEVMRAYRGFDIPGVDVLADWCHHNALKQVQSVAHQRGKSGVMCECYGVTNWDFDFRGHKRQGDWLAALGVNARVPHLSWAQMGGEAKRDYPATLDGRSPWFEKYTVIENHLARVAAAMDCGRPVVRVGVIHPIESYWLLNSGDKDNSEKCSGLERRFRELTEWLLFGLMDFDFVAESSLPEIGSAEDGRLCVGAMHYDVIVVPPLYTIRQTTLDMLNAFAAQGGRVIFMGNVPGCVDGRSVPGGARLPKCVHIGFECDCLLENLDGVREIDIRRADNGERVDEVIYQLREAEGERYLFVAHGWPKGHGTKLNYCHLRMTIPGKWRVICCDTETGEMHEVYAAQESGKTEYLFEFKEHDSLLLKLIPGETIVRKCEEKKGACRMYRLPAFCDVQLHEANVLLLDMPRWRLDGGKWHEKTYILTADDEIRRTLNLPMRTESALQPWLQKAEPGERHSVVLQYDISSEYTVEDARLALEGSDYARIFFNGREVGEKVGCYLDSAIECVSLGRIEAGHNILSVEYNFDRRVNLESMYILGDFGVRALGDKATITAPVKTIAFGDAAEQNLAFYGGSITYQCRCMTKESGRAALQVADYSAPVLGVRVDGGEEILIYAFPYKAQLGYLSAGEHEIAITAYGNRVNTFGALHNWNMQESVWGPYSWRSGGVYYGDAYRLRSFGVTCPPVLIVEED